MKLENASFFDHLIRNIRKEKSFTLTGLTTFSRLLLLDYICKLSDKKVLFVTSTEQAALKYSADLERLFERSAETLLPPSSVLLPASPLSGEAGRA